MVKKVIIESAHVLYVSFTLTTSSSFMPIYVGQDGLSGTLVYVSLRQFTLVGRDVELDKIETNVINYEPFHLMEFIPANFGDED